MSIKRVFCSILSLLLTFTAISSTLAFSNSQPASAATSSVYNFNYGSGISWPSTDPLPTFSTPADTVDVVDLSRAPLAWKYTILSLQGIVNAKQPRILISYNDGRNDWINRVVSGTKNNITISSRNDMAALINKYRSEINGIILYNDRTFYEHSANVALSVAGVEKCIVTYADDAWYLKDSSYITNPLSVKIDLNNKFGTGAVSAYTWLYNNYYKTGKLNKRLLVTLNPTDHATHFSDYAVATKSAILWLDPLKADEEKVLDLFFDQATVGVTYNMGWWLDEDPGVCYATKKGVSTIPADYYENASFYSGQSKEIKIKEVPKKPKLENKMYVALALSDGDNTQYNQGTMRALWDDRRRLSKDIPISWTVSPALYYTGPQIYNYFQEHTTGTDMLISGPSGLGYTKSTRWRTKSGFLPQYLKDTNTAFEKTGLNIITIWDRISEPVYKLFASNLPSLLGSTINNNDFNDADKTNSDSMFYYGYKYYPENGDYKFYNDRPIFGLGPKSGYLRNTGDAKSDIIGKMANFNSTAPKFVFKQFVAWDVNPRQLIDMANELKELYGDKIEFVRADHFFMLMNEANNVPYNLALSNGVTASASSSQANNSVSNAIDGTFTTGWTANATGQSWYQLDLGERCEISRYTLKNAQTGYYSSTQNTKAYQFQYSLDGVKWSTIDNVTNNSKAIIYKTFSNTIVARYVRVLITDAGSDNTARIQDLEVYGTKLGITNNSAPVTVTKVKLSCPKSTMNMGDTTKLNLVVSPSNANNRAVTFKSSNSKALAVDQSGNVKVGTVTKPTNVTLTATSKDGTNKSASVTVTVRTGKVESLKLSATKKTLNIGKKYTVKATVAPTTAKNKAITWTTSNKKVATVNNGVITAKGPGIAKITAKAKDGSGKKATITITVKPKAVTNLSVKKASSTSAKITFKKQKSITKYEIYAKKGNGKWKKVATTSKASCTVKKLTKKAKYSFRVRAYKTSSSKKVYGDYSKIKTLKLK